MIERESTLQSVGRLPTFSIQTTHVVYQHIEACVTGHEIESERPNLLLRGKIGKHQFDRATSTASLDVCYRRLSALFVAAHHYRRCSLFGNLDGNCLADASRGAGYESNLSRITQGRHLLTFLSLQP